MLIEGIHYCVALYEIDADGFPNLIESFIDFHALNEFIRRNNNESYKAKELHYSIVELINGEASACSWTAPMEFTEFSETRIAEEIENFIEDEKDNEELNRKIDAFNKEIHYSLHTALPGGRWCGGERPECGVSGRSVKII